MTPTLKKISLTTTKPKKHLRQEILALSQSMGSLAESLTNVLSGVSVPIRQSRLTSLQLSNLYCDLEAAHWDTEMPYQDQAIGTTEFVLWAYAVEDILVQPPTGRKIGIPRDLHKRLSAETLCLLKGLLALHRLLQKVPCSQRSVATLSCACRAVQKMRDHLRLAADQQYGTNGDLYNCKAEPSSEAYLYGFARGMQILLDQKVLRVSVSK